MDGPVVVLDNIPAMDVMDVHPVPQVNTTQTPIPQDVLVLLQVATLPAQEHSLLHRALLVNTNPTLDIPIAQLVLPVNISLVLAALLVSALNRAITLRLLEPLQLLLVQLASTCPMLDIQVLSIAGSVLLVNTSLTLDIRTAMIVLQVSLLMYQRRHPVRTHHLDTM